jgi:formylglycine-generating enzyme required for sulfatase activity
MKDYYYILGVKTDATTAEIKTAYRRLSLVMHPDKNGGDKFFADRFVELNEAHETLVNATKRSEYDEAKRLLDILGSFSNQQGRARQQSKQSTPKPEIIAFQANKKGINIGDTITFSWQTFYATKVELKPTGLVDKTGEKTFRFNNLDNNTSLTFELVVENSAGTIAKKIILENLFQKEQTTRKEKEKAAHIREEQRKQESERRKQEELNRAKQQKQREETQKKEQAQAAEAARQRETRGFEAWQSAQISNTAQAYQVFLKEYPEHPCAREAKHRLEGMPKEVVDKDGNLILIGLIVLGVIFFFIILGNAISVPNNNSSYNEPTYNNNSTYQSQPAYEPAPSSNNVQAAPVEPIIEQQTTQAQEVMPTNEFDYPMVRVSGGTYLMGSPKNEANRDADECQHSVTVANFSIGKYEVTQAQWRSVMGNNPSNFKNCEDCPVENVSWNDIQTFITKLNKANGTQYRLPKEEEWEYAARGGNKSNNFIYAGSNDLTSVAWCSENSDRKTHSVGQKKANELGIYDMSGNVWEWCYDTYKPYQGCAEPKEENKSFRVLRGGSWINFNSYGVAVRNYLVPTFRYDYYGFRLAQGY